MEYSLYDLVGNLGVFLIILSYLLLQLEKISNKHISYSVMNFLGAVLVIISLLESFNFSAFIIELFWVIISIIGIVKYLQKDKTGSATVK